MTPPALVAASAAGLTLWLLVPSGAQVSPRPTLRPAWPLAVVVAASLLLPRSLTVPGLLLVAAGWGARTIWRRRAATREAETNAGRMAEVCDLLAAELGAGRPPEAALEEAAITWTALRPVADACRLGGDVPGAFRAVAATPGAGGLRLLAAAWTVSQRTGGSLGPATRRVADAIRRDRSTRRVIAGELASARATARLVAGLPVVALLMGSGAGADPWSFLDTPPGWVCLAGGLGVGFVGLWWIELLARGADP